MKQAETNIRLKFARPYIPNAVFYIPFAYYYAVRLGTLPKLFSWMLIYLMPTAFYSAMGYTGSWPLFALNYGLILLAVFSIYECGYIANDTLSIRHEELPSIRLYANNFEHFERHKALIFASRIGYSLLALPALYALNGFETALRIGLSILVMAFLFGFYNCWRSRYNVWLYPFLVCSRYIPFMLLVPHPWEVWLLLFLSFPLLNALERFSMPRYRWPLMRKLIPSENSKTLFRAVYYSVVLLLTFLLVQAKGYTYILLVPIMILCLYRVALVFWLKKHNPENYLNG